ncbi:hypothetical protein B0H13DRAFT_1615683 [Mycena leptocephala]|nr:hypothetical protein B0H13DRAFT_1676196 [Mycena leptocephala]KAJ7910456.1 hypothetical protein B0H13DRAFT_1615683 [Mycena leptocephala]
MKLINYLILGGFLVVYAFAQGIRIGAPANGTTVRAGSKIIIEVDRPDTLTPSIEIAIVIGFLSCGAYPCPSPLDRIGTILYNGGYRPEWHNIPFKPPHQNFTVTIPKATLPGKAELSVIHFTLVGAGPWPLLESRNVTLVVVN